MINYCFNFTYMVRLVLEVISKTCKRLNMNLYQPLRRERQKIGLKQIVRSEKLLSG